jgi:hypothetical protein
MTYKQIEASREARLWIGQVIVPAVAAAVMLSTNPSVRYAVATKAGNVKRFIKKKFRKTES